MVVMLFSYMTADITTYEIYITYLRNESPTDSDVTSLLHEGLTTADVTINVIYTSLLHEGLMNGDVTTNIIYTSSHHEGLMNVDVTTNVNYTFILLGC